MLAEFRSGPATLADSTLREGRSGHTGEVIVGDAHGKYHEATSRAGVFMAANQAAATFTLFGTTTATGFLLSNPSGSGKNLSVLQIGFLKIAAQGAQIENLVLSGAYAAQTLSALTALTTRCALVGSGATGVGVAYSAATLSAAGVILAGFCAPQVSATAGTAIPPVQILDVAGSIVVAPGAWLQLAAGFTNTISGVAHMMWEETPV